MDLYLIHQPMGDYIGAYRAMEEAYKEGKTEKPSACATSIRHRLADLCETVEVIPAVNQVELHPFFQQENALALMKEYGVHSRSLGTFCRGKTWNLHPSGSDRDRSEVWKERCAGGSAVERAARCDGDPQILARWMEHQCVWDFELSAEDMAEITKLDLGHSEIR